MGIKGKEEEYKIKGQGKGNEQVLRKSSDKECELSVLLIESGYHTISDNHKHLKSRFASNIQRK